MKSSCHSLIPLSWPYPAPANPEDSTPFNSKLISRQAGVSQLDPSLPTRLLCFYYFYYFVPSQSQSYVTTDGQSASLSWNKAPIWGLRPDLDYCLTVAGLLIWGALSDERTGLSFAIATGPRQRSHIWVRVP
jgi:hypothetical protein